MPFLVHEIVIQTVLILAILGGVGLYVRYKVFPELKNYAEMAPVRFWKTLTEKAAEDEGASGSGAPGASPGTLNLGGFSIDVQSVKAIVTMLPQIAEFLKTIQSFGFLTGGGSSGSGTPNPFLKQ